MWETSIYKFKIESNGKKEDLLIDVTGSAPSFSTPGKQLEQTFDVIFKDVDPKTINVLDFGAAKLRNTIYLLQKGFNVYSCEFNDLFVRSQQANNFLSEAKKYPNFKELIFPYDFIESDIKFDIVLLINVLNVMPIQLERLCVLTLCRDRMREDGKLLWYTQHGAYNISDAVAKLLDGMVTGKGRKYHMFYRDFSRREIHEMLASTGFSYNPDFKFPFVGTNQAYIFDADGEVLVDSSLGLTELLRKGNIKLKTVDRKVRWGTTPGSTTLSEKVAFQTKEPVKVTKPVQINILKQYSEELKTVEVGNAHASKYHKLIFNILKSLFEEDRLRKGKIEQEINEGRKRVDIVFDNKSKLNEGFFYDLKAHYGLISPYIFIECKNYAADLKNPEIDQIAMRLNKRRGQFGMVFCRKITQHKKIISLCRDLIREKPGDEPHVIVLDDSHVRKMIDFKLNHLNSEIDDLLAEKIKEIIL